MGRIFRLKTKFCPAGDQPKAIEALYSGLAKGMSDQTLLGVTGSGKTFTIANVIEKQDKPVLVIAHNKTLAAQLAQEYREFFPDNAVHYFVSYYDYYVPEAYIPTSDTYIEKDADINEEIDRLRHASTQALLTRRDVIIVASVSCIYGLGNPEEYKEANIALKVGMQINRTELLKKLVSIYYERTNADLKPGKFRAVGNNVEVVNASDKTIYKAELVENKIKKLQVIDFITRKIISEPKDIFLFPAKHFVTEEETRKRAETSIK
jgi:excinuclease ABC subunit B